ncbi:hypothetical protein PHYPSEUDO_008904 [Phytophthora pseudosyringae]|uniref:Uncharacterized protein n=1 Tax=Phytophthora pseudosyringae TaxID=221518 RepID=A0A8T1VG15_9STRA|nr:hypothetical protein PHYPSEUDO_008904 [Phytophthora pseudosyringae]
MLLARNEAFLFTPTIAARGSHADSLQSGNLNARLRGVVQVTLQAASYHPSLREEERVHGHDGEGAGHVLTLALPDTRGLPAKPTQALVLARQLSAVEERGELHLDVGAGADEEQDDGEQPLEAEERRLQTRAQIHAYHQSSVTTVLGTDPLPLHTQRERSPSGLTIFASVLWEWGHSKRKTERHYRALLV